jgi:hypothetical protein
LENYYNSQLSSQTFSEQKNFFHKICLEKKLTFFLSQFSSRLSFVKNHRYKLSVFIYPQLLLKLPFLI